jgi:hypothetical protein
LRQANEAALMNARLVPTRANRIGEPQAPRPRLAL